MVSAVQPNVFQKFHHQFDSFVDKVGAWLDKHPYVNTIVVIANHIFRALSMLALMTFIPGPFIVQCGIALSASLFYRVTIERFCHFRFAIPSCLGATAMNLSAPAVASIVHGVANQTLAEVAKTAIGISPLVLYTVSIIWISHSAIQSLDVIRKAKEAEQAAKNPKSKPACCCDV
jgi:hypothetical protein